MSRIIIILLITIGQFASAQTSSDDMQTFLKSCGYGILGGAVAGTVSLVLENKPSEHYNNIARGASLGLYVGIAYGIHLVNQNSDNLKRKSEEEVRFILIPQFNNSKLDGFESHYNLLNF